MELLISSHFSDLVAIPVSSPPMPLCEEKSKEVVTFVL